MKTTKEVLEKWAKTDEIAAMCLNFFNRALLGDFTIPAFEAIILDTLFSDRERLVKMVIRLAQNNKWPDCVIHTHCDEESANLARALLNGSRLNVEIIKNEIEAPTL